MALPQAIAKNTSIMLVPPLHLWIGFDPSTGPVACIQLGDQLPLFFICDKVEDNF